jgi:hypothetical protein
MGRKYEDKKEGYGYRYKRKKNGELVRVLEKKTYTVRRRGLKIVHIGEDVWRIGRDKVINGRKHQVIYGPDNKQYDLWNEAVDFVNTPGPNEPLSFWWKEDGTKHFQERHIINRNGCKAYESKVKIYILTHILDQKENWCFDLSKLPAVGKLKVIYANGTVKNIDFDGEFKDNFISWGWKDEDYKTAEEKGHGNFVPPFAYRII